MPKIRLLDIPEDKIKTPGFRHESITKAKKEGTVLDTVSEDMQNNVPCYRIRIPGSGDYIWYVYKYEAQIVRKPTVIVEE